jgi:putative acetyltransferase
VWPRIDGHRTLELGTAGEWRTELNDLVLAGTKTSTMGLLADYAADGEVPEHVGERIGLLGNDGELEAWLTVTRFDAVRFGDLVGDFGESVAASCGEGFADAKAYRAGYARYWQRAGHQISDDTEVAVLWFAVTERVRGWTPILREGRSDDFPALVGVWRSAVDASHHFLADDDRNSIENLLASHHLPAVRLTVAELDGEPIAFAGTKDSTLEMLFVHDAFRGRGVGSMLIDHVVREEGIIDVDVNEQNSAAVSFYASRGFTVVGRSALDEAGRPYPLVHMSRAPTASAPPQSEGQGVADQPR